VRQEQAALKLRKGLHFKVSFKLEQIPKELGGTPRVAILREEGSNGDREMASAFHIAGFEVWDIVMADLVEKKVQLDIFAGIAFVGGFSYADVMDSAKGWAGVIRHNKHIWVQFEAFYQRANTFSLGVCNGCQLMALLGWIPWRGLSNNDQPRFIHNKSGRYESRFCAVTILPSPSVMLKGMEGSTLGVWVAHGEGHAYFNNQDILATTLREQLAPIRFVNDNMELTEEYPFNPNGSPQGITSLCSRDGRHLAMMPHPERSVLKWQWPYLSKEVAETPTDFSPWIKMFQNAKRFCNDSDRK